jgi:glycerol-3-phosphate dehydrogenase (NAD(P)+)
MQHVTVIGAGSWGTALSIHLARVGHRVRLWVREPELYDEMCHRRVNMRFLPEVVLPDAVQPCTALDEALADAGLVVSVVPSHGVRTVLRAAAPFIPPGVTVVSATKGLEAETLMRMSQVCAEELGDDRPVAVLSGPSFASEVARELPTAVSVACADARTAETVQAQFRARYFRLYATSDVVGVELGGALKNVIAIAAGTVEGLRLGHNVLAALITRGLAEMSRLAVAAGARRETLAGLTGLGDLVLTCTGDLSRNRRVGIELGRGHTLRDILAGTQMVAEGVHTTFAALALGERYGVELPIAAQMSEVLAGRKDPRAAVEDLMLRPQRSEAEAE